MLVVWIDGEVDKQMHNNNWLIDRENAVCDRLSLKFVVSFISNMAFVLSLFLPFWECGLHWTFNCDISVWSIISIQYALAIITCYDRESLNLPAILYMHIIKSCKPQLTIHVPKPFYHIMKKIMCKP